MPPGLTFSGLRTKRDVLGGSALDLLLGRHFGLCYLSNVVGIFLTVPTALELNIAKSLPSVP